MATKNSKTKKKADTGQKAQRKAVVSQEDFVRACITHGYETTKIAEALGMANNAVTSRAKKMREAGVKLPALKSASNTRLTEERVASLNDLLAEAESDNEADAEAAE